MKLRILLPVLTIACGACGDEPTRSTESLGPNIEIVAGDSQTATAGSPVPAPLVVRVSDTRGRPVAGRTVRFQVVEGGGSVLTDSVKTDGQGIARQAGWTLGTNARSSQILQATVAPRSGEQQRFVFFNARAVVGAPAQLIVQSGSGRSALPRTALDTLILLVRDEFGNPISDFPVGWALGTGGGSIVPVASRTDSAGAAKALWVLGAEQGQQFVSATSGGLSAIFTVVVGTPFLASMVASGGSHSCGITAAGATYCWGNNNFRQLGGGAFISSPNAVRVTGLPSLVSLAVGDAFSCGLTAAGAVYCWGSNSSGQLGNGNVERSGTAAAVVGNLSFIALVAGGSHVCGIANDSRAYCWGENLSGQLGNNTVSSRLSPSEVSGGIRFITLAAGYSHTCGVATDGETYCWGSGGAGQLGFQPTTTCDAYYYGYSEPCSLVPVRLPSALRVTTLATGLNHTCAIATDETAYCWGSGIAAPSNVPGGLRFAAISAGTTTQSCGITANGEAYCWQLRSTGISTPLLVSDRISFASLTLGSNHMCGIARVGQIAYCRGDNWAGQLGDGTTFFRADPVPVVSPIAP